MTKDEFIKTLESNCIDISTDQINLFDKYAKFLLEYNKTTNLTAIRDEEGIYLKHFYDSILVISSSIIDFNKYNNLIDIGTGAGFPGLVLKIMYPHLNVTLLDSNNKKTTFLKKLVSHLGLSGVNIVNDRAENYVIKHRQEYDLSIARAVSELRIIAELCLPLTKVGGHFIAMKSNYEEELKNAMPAIKIMNSNLNLIKEFELPKEKSKRVVIDFFVEGKIDDMYPRRYEQIIKKSLK